jgi:hypothetical protein
MFKMEGREAAIRATRMFCILTRALLANIDITTACHAEKYLRWREKRPPL